MLAHSCYLFCCHCHELIIECLWDGVSENDDLSYVFDETTPVKACGDLAYHVTHNGEDITPFSNPSVTSKEIVFSEVYTYIQMTGTRNQKNPGKLIHKRRDVGCYSLLHKI